MFCPVCSQEQVSDETRFCSRCGFLLTGISRVISNGGVLPNEQTNSDPNTISQRKKGLKQGTLLIFAGIILVPILAIITIFLRAEPYVVAIAAVLAFGGGILRLIYALLFESTQPQPERKNLLSAQIEATLAQKMLSSAKVEKALPPQQSVPASGYMPPNAGTWRDTNDLVAPPPSVTDPTTKLLEKE